MRRMIVCLLTVPDPRLLLVTLHKSNNEAREFDYSGNR